MGIEKLMIELDSRVLLDLVWGGFVLNLKLRPIILDCRRMCRKIMEVRGTHIFREANQAAGFLAKEARGAGAVNSGYNFLAEPLEGLRNILNSDYMGLLTPRTVNREPPKGPGLS